MLAEGWLWVLFHHLDIHIGGIFYRFGKYIPGTSWRHGDLWGKWFNAKVSTFSRKCFSSVERGSCDWLVEVILHWSWREKPSRRSGCFLLTVSSSFWIGANWAAVKMPASHWLKIWPLVKTDPGWLNWGDWRSNSLPRSKNMADTRWLDFGLKLPPMFVTRNFEIKQKGKGWDLASLLRHVLPKLKKKG